jgi:hypothetical protein
MQAAGTKQRIMQGCSYNPTSPRKAVRPVRVVTERGATQTYKKKGDFMLVNDRMGLVEVKHAGWL